jgi:hypothetical protein
MFLKGGHCKKPKHFYCRLRSRVGPPLAQGAREPWGHENWRVRDLLQKVLSP